MSALASTACERKIRMLSTRQPQGARSSSSHGEVAEWLNAPHSKCGIGASLSGVRIPPSPPLLRLSHLCDLISRNAIFSSKSFVRSRVTSDNRRSCIASLSAPTNRSRSGAATGQQNFGDGSHDHLIFMIAVNFQMEFFTIMRNLVFTINLLLVR